MNTNSKDTSLNSRLENFLIRLPLVKYNKKSYSQEGEDILLGRIFDSKSVGFYVDIGAHHPKRFSNTYWAYKKGWSGICIDPMEGLQKMWRKSRPRDLFIEKGVSTKKGFLDYYKFSDPALNTFSLKRTKYLQNHTNHTNYKLKDVKPVSIDTLENILDSNTSKTKISQIDFMSVDVEGEELQVLMSNNFNKYRPHILVIEVNRIDILNMDKDRIAEYLSTLEYKVIAVLYHSVFFLDSHSSINWRRDPK